MFLRYQMVHQQVDVARSQFPMGRAAELASHMAHSHTPRLCGSHKPAPLVTGDHAKWGLVSAHSTAKRSLKSALRGTFPRPLANKRVGDELDQNRYEPMSPT